MDCSKKEKNLSYLIKIKKPAISDGFLIKTFLCYFIIASFRLFSVFT